MESPPTVPASGPTCGPPTSGPTIYSAIYSGVPVYEMMCRDTPVMRRMADAYMNATQILKVAGFTKPKRTKILEREVLQGEHEKIQGGYGKYQGTWIPLSESRLLAGRYKVEADLRPLFDFDPQTGSVAPKPPTMRSSNMDFHGDLVSPSSPSPPPHGVDFFSAVDGASSLLSGYNSRDGSITPQSTLSPPPTTAEEVSPPSWQELPSHLNGSASAAEGSTPHIPEQSQFNPQVQSMLDSIAVQQGDNQLQQPVNRTTSNSRHPSPTMKSADPPALSGAGSSRESPGPSSSNEPLGTGLARERRQLPQAHSIEADYYQKLQQGLLFDETTAQNYVTHIQQILRTQDLQQYQQAQHYSSYLQAGSYPAVQSAYQQLAMLNLLSLAAQHAYTYPNGCPSLESWFKRNEHASTRPQEPAGTGSGEQAAQVSSSPEQSKVPVSHRVKSPVEAEHDSDGGGDGGRRQLSAHQLRQREVMANLYLYGDSHLYKIIESLKSPTNPRKLDVNMVLDGRRGSTLLHFAASLGRAKLVKALLNHGANSCIAAHRGETPLMRAVYHVGCYDSQTFPQIADLLRDSVYLTDSSRRTVLHHVAKATRRRRDFWAAAGYYARWVAQVIQEEYSEAKESIPQVVNAQDAYGNTALHYACKYGSRSVAEVLLTLGATHEVTNNAGETPVDLARYDPRLLALLFKDVEREDLTSWEDFDEDGDVLMRELENEATDSEDEAFERSPSPNPVEQNLHEQTMHHLDKFYGERVEKILSKLTPSVTNIVKAGVDQLRDNLLSQYREQEARVELTQIELERAKEQLASAKQELAELQGKRRRMEELVELANDLEEQLRKHTARLTRKGKGKRGRGQSSETEDDEETLDIRTGPEGVVGHDPATRWAEGTPAEEDAMADTEVAQPEGEGDVSSLRCPPSNSISHAPDPAAAGGGPASTAKRKRSFTPADGETAVIGDLPPSKLRRLMTGERTRTRSGRQAEVRLKAELAELQREVERSEQNRLRMFYEIENIRAHRHEKDRKFKRIIAACVRMPIDMVDEIIEPLVRELE